MAEACPSFEEPTRRLVGDHPLLPDYRGACITKLVPALLQAPEDAPAWIPSDALRARQTVLLVLDGLGWLQLQDRVSLTPTLNSLPGIAVTTVAPSTTASALASLTTGLPPGEHGLIGYRVSVDGEILNVLRWRTARGDARTTIPPESICSEAPFCGERPPVVTRAEFIDSGFTLAHLAGARIRGYRMPSTLATEVSQLVAAGEPFVYAYYDGIDKVAHEYGLGEHYAAELAAVDHLVAYLISILPPDSALVITADHGQVDTGDDVVALGPEVLSLVDHQSGEGRFRWLHALPGAADELCDVASARHGDDAWVCTREEMIVNEWFGPVVTDRVSAMIGDVALVARADVAFDDPADTGPFVLRGRHGSLTEAELLVPLLVARR